MNYFYDFLFYLSFDKSFKNIGSIKASIYSLLFSKINNLLIGKLSIGLIFALSYNFN